MTHASVEAAAPRASAAIPARNPGLRFDPAEVPRAWLAGSPVATNLANAVNLLFPAGERFFVRSVKRYLDRVDDEALRAEVRGFFGQEGQHARAHEAFFEVLRAQGYEIDGFLRAYQRLAYGGIERVAPPELRLAATVALEHYTALMAENALAHGVLDAAHPTMQALLKWHAAEEIEHKAVAFDVLARVNPSYALRIAGLAVATATLAGFWLSAFAALSLQDARRGLPLREQLRQLREAQRERPIAREVFAKGIRQYLARDFHPSRNDNGALAATYLRAAGLA